MTKLVINGVKVTIGWAPVLVTFLVICMIMLLVERRYMAAYKKAMRDYLEGNHENLRPRLLKLQKHYYPLISKETAKCNIFNTLCLAHASLDLLDGDEESFLTQMKRILKEETFYPKQYMMALYYRMKGQTEEALQRYEAFLACVQQESTMRTVLDYLFAPEHGGIDEETLEQALREFHNPGNLFLMEQNGLTVK
ncbi:MAG: hypothetical protein E7469_07130 [Ruminococcaceae bacterium]|nr:hypothetical protein [Oscillospiraceae bacterium]